MPQILSILVWFAIGASLSSFAGAVASRVLLQSRREEASGTSGESPRNSMLSVLSAPSRCSSCGKRLGAMELVPVFSCIFLGGRCASCGVRFGCRHALVELAGGFFTVFIGTAYLPAVAGDVSPFLSFAGGASLSASIALLGVCAVTDAYSGFVFDALSGWCALLFVCFLVLAGRTDAVAPFFAVAGASAVFSLVTGWTGDGDPVPFAVSLMFPVLLLNPLPSGVMKWFFSVPATIFFSSFTFIAFAYLVCTPRNKRASSFENSPKGAFPLVPRLFAATIVSAVLSSILA